MSASVTPLKPKPAPRTSQREQLAEAIARREALTQRLDAVERAQAATRVLIARLRSRLESADEDIAAGKSRLASQAVAKALGKDLPAADDLAAVRALQTEVREQLAVAIETLAALEREHKSVSAELQIAEMSVHDRIVGVIGSDAGVRSYVERFLAAERQLAEQRMALEWLSRLLPHDRRYAAAVKDAPLASPTLAAWREAISELQRSADVILPTGD
jgi:hypothetical protein